MRADRVVPRICMARPCEECRHSVWSILYSCLFVLRQVGAWSALLPAFCLLASAALLLHLQMACAGLSQAAITRLVGAALWLQLCHVARPVLGSWVICMVPRRLE